MPVVNTKGAASSQGFGEFTKSGPATYIEDVFSTYLYTGNFAVNPINNGIDLAGKGGMVWVKSRNQAFSNYLGSPQVTRELSSDLTTTGDASGTFFNAYNSNGFSLQSANGVNGPGYLYASWTFRKQPKFFDVVTYTGNGSQNQVIAHNLGSAPGCVIIKRTDIASDWWVAHAGVGSGIAWAGGALRLNTTAAFSSSGNVLFTTGTSTSITLYQGPGATAANISGGTYVAYIFASNAGGFGLAGTDNVISCGSYTGTGAAGNAITIGYEPQYLLIKNTSVAGAYWYIYDVMRGLSVGGASAALLPNASDAEGGIATNLKPTATGFIVDAISGGLNGSGINYIYIAIRRGPMRTPTTGTSVFTPLAYTGDNTQPRLLNFGISLDASIFRKRNSAVDAENPFGARLLGSNTMNTTDTSVETPTLIDNWASNIGVSVKSDGKINGTSSFTYIGEGFKRAPGFFDVVCYTGTAGNLSVAHNLKVVPELIITKRRETTGNWWVWHSSFGTGTAPRLLLNSGAATSSQQWFSAISSTSFDLANAISVDVNASGGTYTNYLFATCPNVSKVFSYTGNGTSQTIACGFTGGARFVLIKRTDTTGDWYIWDTSRGIIAGNDPHLSLNTTVAEVTTDDSIDPDSTGFIVNQLAATNINVSAATYIGLAIA